MQRSVLILLLVALALTSFAGAEDKSPALETVDAEYVCMVNDAAYDREQIAVEVEGKTYYGCCDMCKARLAQNEGLRTAIDPVSGNEVDKAGAVIAADAYKRVFYFENEANLAKANEKLSKK